METNKVNNVKYMGLAYLLGTWPIFYLDVLTLIMQETDNYLQQRRIHPLQQQHLHDLQRQIQQSFHFSYHLILS